MPVSFAQVSRAPAGAVTGLRLGEILVRDGLLSPAQLAEALALQATQEAYVPLGQLLIAHGLATPATIRGALTRHARRARLGDVLVRAGALTAEQLAVALETQRARGARLGETLLGLGLVPRAELVRLLWAQLNVSPADLDAATLDPAAARLLNRHYARRHRVLPVAVRDGTLTVALDDPDALAVLDEVALATGHRVQPVAATPAALDRALDRAYGPDGPPPEAEPRLELLEDPLEDPETPGARRRLRYRCQLRADELVRRLLLRAVSLGASDIHLEPLGDRVALRTRSSTSPSTSRRARSTRAPATRSRPTSGPPCATTPRSS